MTLRNLGTAGKTILSAAVKAGGKAVTVSSSRSTCRATARW